MCVCVYMCVETERQTERYSLKDLEFDDGHTAAAALVNLTGSS